MELNRRTSLWFSIYILHHSQSPHLADFQRPSLNIQRTMHYNAIRCNSRWCASNCVDGQFLISKDHYWFGPRSGQFRIKQRTNYNTWHREIKAGTVDEPHYMDCSSRNPFRTSNILSSKTNSVNQCARNPDNAVILDFVLIH